MTNPQLITPHKIWTLNIVLLVAALLVLLVVIIVICASGIILLNSSKNPTLSTIPHHLKTELGDAEVLRGREHTDTASLVLHLRAESLPVESSPAWTLDEENADGLKLYFKTQDPSIPRHVQNMYTEVLLLDQINENEFIIGYINSINVVEVEKPGAIDMLTKLAPWQRVVISKMEEYREAD